MKHRSTLALFLSSRLCTLLFFAFFLNLAAGNVALAHQACTLLPLSIQERTQAAELIVEGKVISQQSFWDKDKANIYTVNLVEVYKVFKGNTSPETVEIITEGGQVGTDLHVYSATLSLKDQQQGVFFLQPTPGNSAGKKQSRNYSVYGSLQGFIQYDLPEGTAQDPFRRYTSVSQEVYPTLNRLTGGTFRVIKNNPDLLTRNIPRNNEQTLRRLIPLITSFGPLVLRAGTGDVLTITGTNFGSTRGSGYVEFKDADNGGTSYIKPLPTDYVSWTDTEIKVKVPSSGIDNATAGSGNFRVVNSAANVATSPAELTIIYAASNVLYKDDGRNLPERSYLPQLINQNGLGGYTFRFGASFEANKPALYAFRRSMNEWSCNTYVNWITDTRTPIATTAADNINSVRFATAGEMPANVLGRCISRYKICLSNSAVIGVVVSEMDLEFALRADWQYGPGSATAAQFDFESVTLHELGHGHQLTHLILPRAVMHYAVARAQQSRSLSPTSDIAGGRFIMSISTDRTICSTPPMVPKPQNNCAITVQPIALRGEYRPQDNSVLLQWSTDIERDLTEFVVERSVDGINFTPIGTVPATGTATSGRSYQFIDPNPADVLTYYRLRVVKSTSQNEYSEVAEVGGPAFMVQLAPNPGGATTYLYYTTPVSDQLQIEVYDPTGRIHASFVVLVEPTTLRYQITMPGVGQGLFLVRWRSRNNEGVLRYLKLN